MYHALIVNDDTIVDRAIQQRLETFKFTSFDHCPTEEQAVAAATRRLPDLLVLGNSLEIGSPMGAALRVNWRGDIPVLMIHSGRGQVFLRHPKDVRFEGPFLLNDVEVAVEDACLAC